ITVVPGTTYNLHVGAGASGNNNNEGGESWFRNRTTVMAKGGHSVGNNSTSGVNGGLASQGYGTTRINGQNGGNAVTGGNVNSRRGGNGGNGGGPNGGAGGNGRTYSQGQGAGHAGNQPGGGGGGAYRASSGNRLGGAGGDGKVVVTYNGQASIYCDAEFWRTRPITSVNFAGSTTTSSASTDAGGYELFCSPIRSVNRSQSYTITLKGNTDDWYIWGYPLTDFRLYFTVFIDWNQDGDFNDSGERINISGYISQSSGTDSKSISQNITIPAGAKLGQTKMRIVAQSGTEGYVNNACEESNDFHYGQVEDYLLEVNDLVCQQPTSATANNQSSLTICEGEDVTLRQAGGQLGSGQTWKWYVNNPSGALVSTSTNSDASIMVNPTTTTTYYVRAEGGVCGTGGTGKTVTVMVKKTPIITHSSGSLNQTVCTSSPIQNVVFNIGGGATGASVSGLPLGLNGSYSAGIFTISGSSNQAGSFTYTVTTTGGAPCENATFTGQITLVAKLSGLKYSASNKFTFCKDGQIAPLIPSLTGGTANSYSLDASTPSLPAGLSLDPLTGIISGTPTATQSAANYIIIASNGTCQTQVTIEISVTAAGAQSFNVIPSGNYEFCSSPISTLHIKLEYSEAGKNYQLYRDGIAVGSAVAGDSNGGEISFGNHSAAGVYTIKTTDACGTLMNGSVNITVTPIPTTTFTYPSGGNFCTDELTAVPLISGDPKTGVFSSTSGLVFVSIYTGEIDLENSTPGTYIVTYTIAASGRCALYSTTGSVTINGPVTAYQVQGGGEYCVGATGPEITLSGSQTGVSYQLYRDGNAVGSPVPGTGSAISFGNHTVAGNYYVNATDPCGTEMDGDVNIIARPVPMTPVISASTNTICEGTVLPLIASAGSPVTTNLSKTVSSGNKNFAIPDNNSNGTYIPLSVSGIPANAVITEVLVTFNITHSDTRQLIVNLKGPNGNVLNVANKLGGNNNASRTNFTNTRINTSSTTSITTAVAPFSSIYKAQGALGVVGAGYVINNSSNVPALADLLDGNGVGANGVWILSVRDDVSSTSGTFVNWSIQISYKTISNTTQVTWAAATDLFSDPATSLAYTSGTEADQVFFKPASSGSKTYTATSTNEYGCTASSPITITVKASPALKVAADYCIDIQNSKIVITATDTSNSGINSASWKWSSGYDDGPINTSSNSTIKTKTSGNFHVSALGTNGCLATGTISIAQELVVNGDFEDGDVGFESDYLSAPEMYTGNSSTGLYPEDRYAVHNNPQDYHKNFWGTDHTRADGTGKFMMVNGFRVDDKVIWRQTVTVLPNTKYYFSAYAVSLNNVSPFADLVFRVNGVQVGVNTGPLASKPGNNNPGVWKRFYGEWQSMGASTAVIEIINLQTAPGGNDFGIDDISFGTLSTFFNLKS
ncbi:MAG TPA: Ig domain-containing protein, partial [Ginsengibacter sp.]|nr:Ig domain-containing protein [Ginsengibacter sp.]